MLASPVNLEDLPGLARLVARMIFIQKGSQGLRVFTEACEPLQIYHLSSCSYSCPVQGQAQDLVIMNIEKNFALGTEKIIIFHPVSPVWPGLSPGPDLPLPSLFGRDIKPILPLETKESP